MAITVHKPAAAGPAPQTTLQGLLDTQAFKFAKPKEVSYCFNRCHIEGNRGERFTHLPHGTVSYSDRMKQITENVFQLMKNAAFAGKTEVAISIHADLDTSPAIHFTVLEFLRDQMKLGMSPCTWPLSHLNHLHSSFCELKSNPLDLTLSWGPMNPYLNPKPMLQLPVPEVWGVEKLNQERKGDLTVVFGNQHSFSVHRLVVKSFSPFLDSMLRSDMKEASSPVLEFPEVTYCSQEALEALVTLMYTQKIDLSKLSPSAAIELLELGSFLLSDALKGLALTHLHGIGEKLNPLHVLHLSFLQIKHPSENLKLLCDWLMKVDQQFYERILGQEKVSTEDLFRLFAVSVEFKIEPLARLLKTEWDKLGTAQKTGFVERALANGDHLHILETAAEFCKGTLKTIDSKDADKPGFVAVYKRVNAQVFELNIK